jgi:hypothetical protein
MNCKACRIEIEETDEARPLSQSAGAHLNACAGCRAFSEEHSALRRMIGSLEVVAAPADFDFRLRARLAAVKSESARQSAWPRFAPGARAMALAASFVLLIAVGLVVRQVWLAPATNNQRQEVANKNTGTPNPPAPAPSSAPIVASTPLEPQKNPAPVVSSTSAPGHFRVRQQANSNTNAKAEIISNDSDVNAGGGSNDSVVRSAPPPLTPPGIPSEPGAVVAVPVQASRKTATLTLNFGGAKPQNISLRPVTFGAQDVFERGDAEKRLIPSVQGIW